jgi:hypothetical protein
VRHGEGVVEAARDVEGADEVTARAAMDNRELGAFGACQAVDDLVDRPVPTDRDEQACSARDRFTGEVGQVSGPLGEERVAAQPALVRRARDLRPAAAGGPVVRGRIDQEDGLGANASEAPLAVPLSGRTGFARASV